MNKITTLQKDSLINLIYNMLISNPDADLGDMDLCMEAANVLVNGWIKENEIILIN